MGHRGIEDAYRTGRGSIIMRAVVEVEEIKNRQALVVTELPYQVNPDMLAMKIADLVKDGKVSGIADINDETSGRTGQRLVITLKRDAVAKVVLNNLYKHTQLQTTFGANMLALVDEVPRTLPLDGFIRHWVDHQIEVIVRRTEFRLRQGRGRHPPVAWLPQGARHARRGHRPHPRRRAPSRMARDGLIELLDIDEMQAQAILNMQLRRLAALEREKIQQDHDALQEMIDEYHAILASRAAPARHRLARSCRAIVDKYGDERRTEIVPFDGDMSMEDLIPEEDVVVTITRGGYAKRTRVDQYRSQKRGGKGVRGAQLRGEDVVEHFFTTTTHHWLLFFTNLGRVYRAKAYELPEGVARQQGPARRQPARVPARRADRPGARDPATTRRPTTSCSRPVRAWSRRRACPTTTRTAPVASSRSTCAMATSSSGRRLASNRDDLLLVSRKGQSVRFTATDEACGRWAARPRASPA